MRIVSFSGAVSVDSGGGAGAGICHARDRPLTGVGTKRSFRQWQRHRRRHDAGGSQRNTQRPDCSPVGGGLCRKTRSACGSPLAMAYTRREMRIRCRQEKAALSICRMRSNHEEQLKSYLKDDKIALAATAGDCDSGSSDLFFVLSAGNQTEPSEVVIYLNSFGATDVFYRARCRRQSRASTFRKVGAQRMTISVGWTRLRMANRYFVVTIIRERFGREQPSIVITIVGAAG